MRVLVYGASVTQGFWDTQGGWVQRLRSYYDTKFVQNPSADQPTVFNLGISGDSTASLVKRFKNETDARKFPGEDFSFIFLIGTNNAWVRGDGRPNSTTEAYYLDLQELIKKARKYSQKILFIGLLPVEEAKTTPVPWADIHYTNERLWEFEQTLRQVCSDNDVTHFALFETFQDKIEKGSKLYVDGLHPNDEGHKLIFELVCPVLDEVLDS